MQHGIGETRLKSPPPGLTRRRLLRGATAIGAAIGTGPLLASCGDTEPADSPGTAGKPSGKLSIAYIATADQQPYYKALFAEFEKRYPGVTVDAQVSPIPNRAEFHDQVITRIAGGAVPDVVAISIEGQKLFATRGLVLPLDEYIDRDKAEIQDFLDDVHPILLQAGQLSSPPGETYYLPDGFNTMAIWFNKELLAKAGVEAPTPAWTWDDFLTMARAIKSRTGAFAMHVTNQYLIGAMPWLLTNGASTMNADWSQSTVNSPQAVEAATFMRQLVAEGLSPAPGGTFDPFTALSQDKLAMFGGGRWPINQMRTLNQVGRLGMVPWPVKTKQGSPVGFLSYPIMKGAKNREAAWAWIKFLASRETGEWVVKQGGTVVPPRRSIASSEEFLKNCPPGMNHLYDNLAFATPLPSPVQGPLVQAKIEDAFLRILAGNAAPQAALNQLNDTINSTL